MDELLEVKNMRVQFGDYTALEITQGIVFCAGDRIGIIGNNGAGKSTFVGAVTGLVNYTGMVETKLCPADMAIHLQENAYIKRMPVKTILEAVLNTSVGKNQKLQNLIEFLEFRDCLPKKFGQLSGGQKQKLTVIMVLFQDRPLTFFDEVTSALDFETRQKLMSKINEWYNGRSNTVCIVSHYYDELENLCNKLLIIDRGRVVAFDTIDELFKKYCGGAVITIQNNIQNAKLVGEFDQIAAPEHLIALKYSDKVINKLIENKVNFKRSDRDIEILFVNALAKTEGVK